MGNWAAGIARFALCSAVRVVVGVLVSVQAGAAFFPIPDDKIDREEESKARRIAAQLLNKWNEGKFEPLSDDFALTFAQALPPEDQEKAHNQLRAIFGDFRSLAFVEALSSLKLPLLTMYRYRGVFSATGANPEIRLVMDEEGKVAGFWVKHWQDDVF
jgi:hypothetical protein